MVVDMTYNTYRNKKEAIRNAKKIIKQTKWDAVKLEGGTSISRIIEYLVKNKIPVMGHLGILPQNERGKFKFKGKKPNERKKIFNQEFIELARSVYFNNDLRSKIKLEINNKFGSEIIEIKSYTKY